ncbi:MAG: hypothetical protein JXA00_06745 [Candidatus Thermoplasmatota archaeon]|nr:hypothetical protein [Candidatus Thermoplasmatota archaeon]
MKKIIFGLVAVFLLVSTVTAKPVVDSQPIKEIREKLLHQIERVTNTSEYKKIEKMVHEIVPEDVHKQTKELVKMSFEPLSYFPTFIDFLVLLTELLGLLFGRIGTEIIAPIVVYFIILIFTAINAFLPATFSAFFGLMEWEGVSWQWFIVGVIQIIESWNIDWEFLGLFGSIIFLLLLIPISVILYILCFPAAFSWFFDKFIHDIIKYYNEALP